jgi:hypothetical protein
MPVTAPVTPPVPAPSASTSASAASSCSSYPTRRPRHEVIPKVAEKNELKYSAGYGGVPAVPTTRLKNWAGLMSK